MKTTSLLILFLFSLANPSIEKEKIYNALSGNSSQNISGLIVKLEKTEPSSINKAYIGSLTARNASFEKGVQKKIKLFKAGVQILETEIKLFPKHTEYRFLRLCIQEHCPSILKYNENIKEDAQLITSNYSQQSKELRAIIFDYAKTSAAINSSHLK